ncbi:MAG: hypothetical protein ACI8QF_002532, partial [Limisphaerales bacterium]
EEVSFEIGGEEKKYRIDSIAAYTPPPSVSAPAVEEEAPAAEEPEADSTAAAN